MMKQLHRLIISGLLCLVALICLSLPGVAKEPIEINLVSEYTGIVPGTTQRLGILVNMQPGWHIYWKNPGGSGLPTVIDWQLPEGLKVLHVDWPYPELDTLAGITSLGYSKQVLIIATVAVDEKLPVGQTLQLKADVSWLGCSESCIPGDASVKLALPVENGLVLSPSRPLFDQYSLKLPKKSGDIQARAVVGRLERIASNNGSKKGTGPDEPQVSQSPAVGQLGQRLLQLHFVVPEELRNLLAEQARLDFYSTVGSYVALSESQILISGADRWLLTIPVNEGDELPNQITGILVCRDEPGWALEFTASLEEALADFTYEEVYPRGVLVTPSLAKHLPSGDKAAYPASVRGLLSAAFAAFVGGIILNLMPCVFPVLSLKVLSFVQHSQVTRQSALKHALVFAFGVLLSFWAVAGILLILRATGQQLGWGFQLQSPFFVVFITYLFFAIGLNLAGLYEVGLGATTIEVQGQGLGGTFFSGVLATIVATPCTAPFMGSAIGYSLSQPVYSSLLVFTALGLGMACPYVILSTWPSLLKRMPRPGAWMEVLKQVLAFPLFATSVYFIWVLDRQCGADSVAVALLGMVVLAFAGWLYGRWGIRGEKAFALRIVALIVSVIALLLGVVAASPLAQQPDQQDSGQSAQFYYKPWSDEAVSRALDEGKPVFIDFGASWCLTCQVNEKMVLADKNVQRAFIESGTEVFKADWTNRDSTITRALAFYGRSGVPVYVYYPPGSNQYILFSELLTPKMVIDVVKNSDKEP